MFDELRKRLKGKMLTLGIGIEKNILFYYTLLRLSNFYTASKKNIHPT